MGWPTSTPFPPQVGGGAMQPQERWWLQQRCRRVLAGVDRAWRPSGLRGASRELKVGMSADPLTQGRGRSRAWGGPVCCCLQTEVRRPPGSFSLNFWYTLSSFFFPRKPTCCRDLGAHLLRPRDWASLMPSSQRPSPAFSRGLFAPTDHSLLKALLGEALPGRTLLSSAPVPYAHL